MGGVITDSPDPDLGIHSPALRGRTANARRAANPAGGARVPRTYDHLPTHLLRGHVAQHVLRVQGRQAALQRHNLGRRVVTQRRQHLRAQAPRGLVACQAEPRSATTSEMGLSAVLAFCHPA